MIYWLELIHLIAAAVWLGGLIILGVSVSALRGAGASRDMLRAVARRVGAVTTGALAVAIVTGVWRVEVLHVPWSYGRLHIKLGLVALVTVLAVVHTATARRTSPAVRGMIQAVILAASLGIFAAAVAL